MTTRGARIQFEGSPWARQELMRDQERAVELAHRASAAGCTVTIRGKSEAGPWSLTLVRGSRSLTHKGSALHDLFQFALERWEAGAVDKGIAWRAGADGRGHAHAPRSPWTLCHVRSIDPRFAHPERSRCEPCWLALDREVVAA